MKQGFEAQHPESKYWKLSFWILSGLIFIIMPLLSRNYGQTGDEWVQIEYGKNIWDYFFNGDLQALDYSNKALQYEKQNLYGGFFDFPMEVLHRWFPSMSILTIRHFFNALYGASLMLFTGLIAKRLSGKWVVGLLALVFMVFSPRIFGESMNNPKDIPFAAGFTIGVYSIIAFLQDAPNKFWRNAIGLGLGWAIAFGVRSAGGILLLAYYFFFIGVYYVFNRQQLILLRADSNKLLKKFVLTFVVAIIGGYILALLTWPYGIESPISNPIAALKEMTNRGVVLRVLFEGVYKSNNAMPWYYEFKWIMMTSPIIIIGGLLAYGVQLINALKKYKAFAVIVLGFSAFFPLLYMIYKNSSVHDTWRHVFFVYPYWAVMGALCFDLIADRVKVTKYRYIPYALAVLGLIPAIIWTFRAHPNQYVFFNAAAGGVEEAYGVYDLDYYQNTSKQAADWIKENGEIAEGEDHMFVRSNMSDLGRYFRESPDSNRIWGDYGRYNERHRLNWDYYVSNPRYISVHQLEHNTWPPKNAVHVIEVGGMPLAAILKRESSASIDAYNAFQAENYDLAIKLYEEQLKVDKSDENIFRFYGVSLVSVGRVDEAIVAINEAIRIDASRPDFYQMLYYMYESKGDKANAQQAYNKMNAASLAQNGG